MWFQNVLSLVAQSLSTRRFEANQASELNKREKGEEKKKKENLQNHGISSNNTMNS